MKKVISEKETKQEEKSPDEETEAETPSAPMRKSKKYLKTSTGFMRKGK